MRYEVIGIQVKGSAQDTKFCAYILDSSKQFQAGFNRPMIILCPGGGYGMTSDREAEPVAMRLLSFGYHVGILRYSVAPARFPTALLELAEAMKLVHANAEGWNVDSSQIFVQGFSAGGHLAACLGVFWDKPFLGREAGAKPDILRPRGLILNYPVITSRKKYAHEGSFRNLLVGQYEEMKKQVSIERQVTLHVPPCFIWHSFSDQSVPVENALLLANALKKAGVSTELHIYSKGGHGVSLGDETTADLDGGKMCKSVQSWIELLHTWLQAMCHKPGA